MVAHAQTRRVQNRPYTDLRPMHFGIVIGAGMQDLEFRNVGQQTIVGLDGAEQDIYVTCDQPDWEMGFNVGVLCETRLNTNFAFRVAPQLYFGTRNIRFRDLLKKDVNGRPYEVRQSMKTVYVGANCDIIYAAERFNNHRPYIMAGLAPMLNLSTKGNDYVQLNNYDVFFEVGLGCDIYMPYFKLRPELKFMLGLTNALNGAHAKNLQDAEMRPYATSVTSAMSKMVVLSFYFE